MRISSLKISTRLTLLSALLIVGSLVIALAGWRSLSRFDTRLGEITAHAQASQSAVDHARAAQVQFKIQIQEWKNLLLRGHDPAAADRYARAFSETGAQARKRLDALAVVLPALGLPSKQASEAHAALVRLEADYLAALASHNLSDPAAPARIDAMVKGKDREPTKRIDDIVETVLTTSVQQMADVRAAGHDFAQNAETVLWTVFLVIALGGIVLSTAISRGITRPIRSAVGFAQRVAGGDLAAGIPAGGRDETGQLLEALGRMRGGLLTIVAEVRAGTESISTGAAQISAGNADLSRRTEEQAANLEETASAMEELGATVGNTAAAAAQAASLAVQAADDATEGEQAGARVIHTMDEIAGTSRKIEAIIGVIDAIAFQTNILALNAGVEAARAGESGKGFAVVAAEVRSLAQRSAAAARDIKALIDENGKCVAAGAQLVDAAGARVNQIKARILQLNDLLAEISVAARHQSAGIGEVGTAVTRLDSVTQQNAALVEEAAAAAQSLDDQARRLIAVVGQFRTGPAGGAGQAATGAASGFSRTGRLRAAAATARAIPVTQTLV